MQKRFKNKPAITMAELIIVVIIVAIVAGIFLAMPKKNVSKLDRAKYYVAYDMLTRVVNEQRANGVTASTRAIITDDPANYATFRNNANYNMAFYLNDILNVVENQITSGAPINMRLSNGMVVSSTTKQPTFQRATGVYFWWVYVDLDGTKLARCAISNPNCIRFRIYLDGTVEPYDEIDSTDWISFRVFRFDDNGNMDIKAMRVSYNDAKKKMDNTDGSGDCTDGNCFMEAIPPL